MNYKKEFLKWLENEKKHNGLIDFKVSFNFENDNKISEDDYYKELFFINKAIDEGNYQIVTEL